MGHNSTPTGTDLMVIERGSTLHKCSFTDWGNSVNPPYVGTTYGIAIQTVWGQIAAGYNQSGRHNYGNSGSMWNTRTDASGAYNLAHASGSSSSNQRPNTRMKIGGVWYPMAQNGTYLSSPSGYGPMNVWYRRSLISWAYTNVELDGSTSGTGSTGGVIQGISFYCYSIPAGSYNIFPNYLIGLKLTGTVQNTTPSNTANYSGSSAANHGAYTQVYSANPKAWTVGWNDFTLSTTFTWS